MCCSYLDQSEAQKGHPPDLSRGITSGNPVRICHFGLLLTVYSNEDTVLAVSFQRLEVEHG